MIKILVNKQSNYPVDTPALKYVLKNYFESKGIVSDSQVSVSIVGEAKMLTLAKKYLNEDNVLHNVLTFRDQEVRGNFVYPPGESINLGEIVICYKKVVEEAKKENKLIDEKVQDLVIHGAAHLMGMHHE